MDASYCEWRPPSAGGCNAVTLPGRWHIDQLEDVDAYKILSQSDCTTLDGVDDAVEFRAVQAAFGTVGMDDDSQAQVSSIS